MSTITPFITETELQTICQTLGRQITTDYQGKTPIIIGVLKGCQPFFSDLIRHITLPVEISYLKVRSYTGITSSGAIHLELDADIAITHRDVILVEDIIDTGTTMTNLYAFLRSKQPNSLKVVALLDKPSQRTTDFHADYIGKTIPNVFVIGYGLDYNEQYRNLPYIGTREGEKDH